MRYNEDQKTRVPRVTNFVFGTLLLASPFILGAGSTCIAQSTTSNSVQSSAATSAAAAPWLKTCDSFAGPKQFVNESSAYCLSQSHPKVCHETANAAFVSCGFQGDYNRMKQRLYAKMLVVWAIAGAKPSVDMKS